MPFSIIFLIIMAFDISNISSILANEQDILDYSSEYIEKYTDEIDTYLPISTDDLIEVSKTESGGNDIVRNLLYALLSSGIRIIKTDQNGSLLEYSGENESHAAIKLLIDKINDDDNPKGRVNRQLYSIVSTNDARYIILLDTVDWNTEIKQTILLSLLGITISILTLAAIARYIAIWTILPVKESISRQNRFIADASHELKTPVSVINANISVLERKIGDNTWMNYIKEEGHTMNLLINQLLTLCRLDFEMSEKNQHQKESKTFELSEALTETILPFDSIAFENNVSLSLNCPARYHCRGDRNDFKQILSIITDNAIRHADRDVKISVLKTHGRTFKCQSSRVLIAVSNTGSVISSEDIPHIFDRFYKSNINSIDSSGNFGLGLSIAKALADKNSYEISAESDKDNTVFSLEIPLI